MLELLTYPLLGYFVGLPLTHLLLWSGLVALTVLVILVVATRWGRSRPLQTCAILSLLLHFLLACLATIVRIVAGFDQVAEGPPIRVRLVQDVAPSPDGMPSVDKQEPTADLDSAISHPQDPVPAQSSEPSQISTTSVETAATEAPMESPAEIVPLEKATNSPSDPGAIDDPTISQPTDAPLSRDETHQAKDLLQPVSPPAEAIASAQEVAAVVPIENELNSASPQPPRENAATPEAATPYANRKRPDRLGFVEREGGSRKTEAAVRAALVWLAGAQSSDGRWDANRFGAGEERAVLGHHRSGAGSQADTGITGLALLSYLGAGYTHYSESYGNTVRHGLNFLTNSQAADGNLSGNATVYARMYCHSMATFALAEAMAITGDSRLEPTVRRAINYSLAVQNRATGGWRYRAGDPGDTSQLGWKVMALRSAERAGIRVPPKTWTSIERFLRSVAVGPEKALASYQPHGRPSRTMTAEALYCRQLLIEMVGGELDQKTANIAAAFIGQQPPGEGTPNFYYWYYGTLALHHQKYPGGAQSTWHQWNQGLKSALLKSQVRQGPEAGSWPATTVWGGYGGRVFTTSLASLCLEVYYRYAPTPENQQPWVASDSGPVQYQR
ncbi:MAG: hypothetical protein MK161_00255 [Pirellulales bacterium]|nr:hypothetical protein [Pirellulales bacterium]